VIDSLNEYKTNLADRLLNDGGQRKIERWFWEMGRPEGLVDFPALYRAIKNHDYSGWIIVESDQSPNPAESAMLNNWYIKNVLDKI
jgi:inosose dehydratase